MEHKKQNTRLFTILGALSALSFGLAACDSSEKSDSGDQTTSRDAAPAGDVAENAIDYSTMISAGEVRDGVAFGDLVMGNPDAPVTMIEYASLTCGVCAHFHTGVFLDIKEQYIAPGKVKFIYRNFTRDPADLAVGMLTRCFGPEQAFDLISVFFERQRQWAFSQDARDQIAALARRVGINRTDFDACLANADLQNNLVEMVKEGSERGVGGTPTFFIEGETFVGSRPLEYYVEIFEDNM